MNLLRKLAVIVVALATSSVAQAGFIVNVYEQDSDTLVVGSGTLDLTGMSMSNATVFSSVVTPGQGVISGRTPGIGLNSNDGFDTYTGFTFSGNAFSGGLVSISSDVSGDSFGVFIFDLIVPSGYVSGEHFSGSMIYANQTLSNLSLSEYLGTYLWYLPQDTFRLVIGSKPKVPVPEPGTIALLGIGLAGMAARRRKTPS